MSAPLILASSSAIRQTLLRNAGVNFDICPADIDESAYHEAIEDPRELSLTLAKEKALSVSKQYPDNYIIGADQVLYANQAIMTKAKTREEGVERIKALQNSEHSLYASVALAKSGNIRWDICEKSDLTMKPLSDAEIINYFERVGEGVLNAVGCYEYEGKGIRLFSKAQGDYFAILGLPLLPLLNALEKEGVPC